MYKSGMTKISRGFTLVELLIVIAILAVLSTATVVVLNPAELLAQARDTQRMTDLDTVKTAVGLYISQVSPVDLTGVNAVGNCMVGVGGINAPFTAACVTNASRVTTGTGWVDVILSGIPGGSPIAILPVDPSNTAAYFYAYKGNDLTVTPNYTFKLAAVLESTKFSPKMANAVDGGIAAGFYEVGTSLAL